MIDGEKIRLRAPLEADIRVLVGMRNDVELQTKLMSIARPNTPQRVEDWLTRRMADDHGLFFIVAERETNVCLGFIQIVNVNFFHGTGSLGIALHESCRGHGFGAEAIELCERYAQQQFRLRKVLLEVLATNAASKLYTRLSYETVGIRRQHFYANGEYLDVILMEKLLDSAAVELDRETNYKEAA